MRIIDVKWEDLLSRCHGLLSVNLDETVFVGEQVGANSMNSINDVSGTRTRGVEGTAEVVGPSRDGSPGKRARSDDHELALPGPSGGAAPHRLRSEPTSESTDDWEMTPELSAAMGLDSAPSAGLADEATPVQRKELAGPGWAAMAPLQGREAPDAGDVASVAEHGVAKAASGLPHQDQIQRSFGRHDVSGVRVQTGGDAADASRAIGADAYATGDRVAFAKEPNLHTAAHEAAHVVQQRAGVHLKGGIGQAGDRHEQHADAVADLVVQGKSAECLLTQQAGPASQATADGPQVVQASFISFAVKMGAKKASKAILEKFIKEQIKAKISKIAIKKFTTKFAKEADDLIGILEDPWWVTGIGFIPLVGDAFDLVHVPKQIAKAMKAADRLEEKVKAILHMQGRRARELLPGTLQRSESFAEELADKTYAELIQLAGSSERAAKMKKLIENEARLMEKL